jgi:hypothetical protein
LFEFTAQLIQQLIHYVSHIFYLAVNRFLSLSALLSTADILAVPTIAGALSL